MEQVIGWKEFNSHHTKVIRTIHSCKNLDQLDGARRFGESMIRYHIHKAMEEPKSTRPKYHEAITSSHEIIQEALVTQKTLLRRGK